MTRSVSTSETDNRSDMLSVAASTKQSVYYPDLAKFQELVADGARVVTVYMELASDLATPVSVYLKLMDPTSPSFLLEAVTGGEVVGRYSFVGTGPRKVLFSQGGAVTITSGTGDLLDTIIESKSILDVVRAELAPIRPTEIADLPRFIGGAVGYLGYDMLRMFENMPQLAPDNGNVPDSIFLITDTVVIFDHAKHRLVILNNANIEEDVEEAYGDAIQRIKKVAERILHPLPAIPRRRDYWRTTSSAQNSFSKEQYEEMVLLAQNHISAGDLSQIVLSNKQTRQTNAHPFEIYRAIRMLKPSSYMFYIDIGYRNLQIIGSSREMHVRAEKGVGYLRPITGNIERRSESRSLQASLLDESLEAMLREDEDLHSQHVGLVDLARSDLGRVSAYGSIKATQFMVIEKYSYTMNLMSQIEGRLRTGIDSFDLMRVTFPSGVVTGIPKIKAIEIIESLEKERRGPYGGAVGYFSYNGNMDSCVAVNTILVKDGVASVQGGSCITAHSKPEKAYESCMADINALSAAIDKAERGL